MDWVLPHPWGCEGQDDWPLNPSISEMILTTTLTPASAPLWGAGSWETGMAQAPAKPRPQPCFARAGPTEQCPSSHQPRLYPDYYPGPRDCMPRYPFQMGCRAPSSGLGRPLEGSHKCAAW